MQEPIPVTMHIIIITKDNNSKIATIAVAELALTIPKINSMNIATSDRKLIELRNKFLALYWFLGLSTK